MISYGVEPMIRWPAFVCWTVELALKVADGRLWLALIAAIVLKVVL
jgi:asparagine N-glycosylation enzyme membrane subunit Stt3